MPVYSNVTGAPVALNPSTATCWSRRLNDQLITACEAGDAVCTPQSMARLLNLPYCAGECALPAPAPTVAVQAAQGAAIRGLVLVSAVAGMVAGASLMHLWKRRR